jgi:hypothetical protein
MAPWNVTGILHGLLEGLNAVIAETLDSQGRVGDLPQLLDGALLEQLDDESLTFSWEAKMRLCACSSSVGVKDALALTPRRRQTWLFAAHGANFRTVNPDDAAILEDGSDLQVRADGLQIVGPEC